MNFIQRNKAKLAVLPFVVGSAFAHAEATLPPEVKTAIDGVKENATTVATTILLAIVAVYAIKFIRKGL